MARTGPGGLDELSRTLRQLREVAGPSGEKMTLERAAALTRFSVPKISRIERGHTLPTPDDAADLARVYGGSTAVQARVRELADTAKATNRRVVLSRANREGFQKRLRDLAESSEQVREFSPIIVPGLLQTPEYIWAIWTSGGGSTAAGARFVSERLGAQAVLDRPDRRVTVLTTEGALGWAAGPPELMVRQLEHIAAVTESPARVGIIPFGVAAPVFPSSNYNLYDERAVVPGILRVQAVLNPPNVAPYVEQWEALEALAAFDGAARDILTRVADRYRALQ